MHKSEKMIDTCATKIIPIKLYTHLLCTGAARYSEDSLFQGSLIRRFVIPNTQISYTWRFVNPKMK